MSIIKNLHLLTDISSKEKSMIEHAGRMHKQFGGIGFTIIEYSPDRVVIKIEQGKSPFEIYQKKERLVQIVHETLGRFFTHKEIVVNAIPYKEYIIDQVNAKWIKEKMQEAGIRLNKISGDTGIPIPELESIINKAHSKPFPRILKAFFYYYFESVIVHKF